MRPDPPGGQYLDQHTARAALKPVTGTARSAPPTAEPDKS